MYTTQDAIVILIDLITRWCECCNARGVRERKRKWSKEMNNETEKQISR